MVGDKLHVGIEALRSLFCYLLIYVSRTVPTAGGEAAVGYQSFRFLNVFVSEEELSVKVGDVYGIEIDNVNIPEPGQG